MISFNAHNTSGKKTLGVIIEQYHNLRLNENSYGLTVAYECYNCSDFWKASYYLVYIMINSKREKQFFDG